MNQQTQTADNIGTQHDPSQPQEQRQRNQMVDVAPPRIPYDRRLEATYGVTPSMWIALIDAIYPSAKTFEGVRLALAYNKARGFDVMKKMVHVVPVWSSKLGREVEGVWPSITETRITAHRTGAFAGCDPCTFGDTVTTEFEGRVKDGKDYKDIKVSVTHASTAQFTVYRIVQGHRVAFPGPLVTYLGSYGKRGRASVPNEKWERTPNYMLEKVAEAAALRRAFPECDDGPTAEEMEGQHVADIGAGDIRETLDPTREQQRATAEQARKDDYERGKQFKQTTGAQHDETHDEETGEIHAEQQQNGQQTVRGDQSQAGRDTGAANVSSDAGGRTEAGPDAGEKHGRHTDVGQGGQATDREPAAQQATSAQSTSAGTAAGPKIPDPKDEPIEFRKFIEGKLLKTGTLAMVEAISADYAEELDIFRVEHVDIAKELSAAFAKRRAKIKNS